MLLLLFLLMVKIWIFSSIFGSVAFRWLAKLYILFFLFGSFILLFELFILSISFNKTLFPFWFEVISKSKFDSSLFDFLFFSNFISFILVNILPIFIMSPFLSLYLLYFSFIFDFLSKNHAVLLVVIFPLLSKSKLWKDNSYLFSVLVILRSIS